MTEWTAGEADEPAPKAPKRKVQAAAAAPQAKAKGRSPLLKWGAGALALGVVILGLWFALGSSGDEPVGGRSEGASGSRVSEPAQDAPADPTDPKNRKSDRLPGPL
jgi:hypothetical protein